MVCVCVCFAVPSANKRDLRSIEQTLIDIRSKKKRVSEDSSEQGQPSSSGTETNTSSSPSPAKRLKLDGREANEGQGQASGSSSITHFAEPS